MVGIQSGYWNPLQFVARNNASSSPATMTIADYAGNILAQKPRLACYADYVRHHPTAANLLVAWIVAEAMEPVRMAATGLLVPVLARRRNTDTTKP